MGNIQENLKEYLSNPDAIIVNWGNFKAHEFNTINKVLNGTNEDFLIFDNRGGRMFDIVFDREFEEKGAKVRYEVKNMIEAILKEHKSWIYCYQLNGEQTILRKFTS